MELAKCDFLSPSTKDLIQKYRLLAESDIQLCFLVTQALKKDAEENIKAQKFNFAEQCYAIALASHVHLRQRTGKSVLSAHDEAVLWSNISLVKLKQGKLDEAFGDAARCIGLDPMFSKGYWRASRALLGLKKYAEAAVFLLKFLYNSQPNDEDFVNFMSEVAIIVTYFTNHQECRVCDDLNIYITESPAVWQKILKMLYEHEEYKAMGILTLGTCGHSFNPDVFCCKVAAVPKLNLDFINVGKLLKVLARKEAGPKEWHLRLAEFIIIRGAHIRTIAETYSKPLIVAVTELSIDGVWPSFLSLLWDRITPAEYDAADDNGNTALHAYVKSPRRSDPHAVIIFHELLKKGCLTCLPDKADKIPLHYVTERDNCFTFLQGAEAVAREGRLKRMKFLHDEGNKACKEKDFDRAIKLYKFAILIATMYFDSSITVLCSNISAAYFSINDFGSALEAAEKCLRNNPAFFKGYFRKGQALVKLGRNHEAIETYLTGLTKTNDTNFKISILEEVVKLFDTVPAKSKPALSAMKKIQEVLSSSWPTILKNMTQSKKWDLVCSLMLGPPYDAYNSVEQGILGSFDASGAVMSTFMPTFFETSANVDISRMSALLLKLFNQGASSTGLSLPEETYYHTVVKFCVHARDTQVLQWILDNEKPGNIHTATDNEGHTPLHTLCLEQALRNENTQIYVRIADVLLSKGVPVRALDKLGKQADEWAVKGSDLKNHLKNKSASKPSKNNGGDGPDTTRNGPRNWKDIKEEGNKAYAKVDYEVAKQRYTEAISCLENDIQSKQGNLLFLNPVDGRNLAILYGNRAECWYKQDNFGKCLEDAKKNVDCDGSWYKGHQRVGKAFVKLGKHNSAKKAFTNAYKTWMPADGEKNRMVVLMDLVDFAYELKLDPSKCFRDTPITVSSFAMLTYEYLKKKDWKKAEFAESLTVGSDFFFESFNPEEIDLVHICDRNQLKDHYKWICRLLLFYLKHKVDYTKLRFHPGDTFFHALISIVVLNPAPPVEKRVPDEAHVVLFHLVDNIVVPQKLQNLRDDKGNTVLHFLATIKGSEPMRQYLAHYLYEKGVSVMATNKEGLLAWDLTKSNDIVRYILQSHMDKESAFIKVAERQKEEESRSKKQQQQRKEPTPPVDRGAKKETGQSSGGAKKETGQSSGGAKKETGQSSGGAKKETGQANNGGAKKNSVSAAAKDKGQEKSKNNVKTDEMDRGKKETSNASAGGKKPCDFCERKLADALAYQNQEDYEKAYLQLVEVINTKKHGSDPRHKNLKQTSLTRVAALLSYVETQEIPKSLIKNISSDGIMDVLNELAKTKKWTQLERFVAQIKDNDRGKALTDFARSMSIVDVIDESSLDGMTEHKMRIVELLLGHGAKLDKAISMAAVTCSMKKSDWKLVVKLLKMGANPRGVTLTPKDTPNHAALQVGISLDPGNFTILEELRNLYEQEKDKYCYLAPSCQDEEGNSLLHLAAKVKFSPHSLRAVELLCEWQTPTELLNKEGKPAISYLTSRNDRRAQYIKIMGTDRKTGAGPSVPRDKQAPKGGHAAELTKNINQKYREEATEILQDLPDVYFDLTEPEEKDRHSEEESEEEEEEDINREFENFGDDSRIEFEEDNLDEKSCVTEIDKEPELNIDVKAFDNLAWDVECTEDVWNILKSRRESRAPSEQDTEDAPYKKQKKDKIPDFLKRVIVNYIYQLARGDWQPQLQRQVKGIPETLQLFQIRLPQGACLLWELAVAFSPRLSETAENLLSVEPGVDEDSALRKGRVYSELIRVWNVVLKSSEVEHFVRKIVRSHQRGKECIIQKKLIGINRPDAPSPSGRDRFPAVYVETDGSRSEGSEMQLERSYFPPASAHRNEFHILKFYSFSSTLVSAILSNTETKIDFPFRVTDIEHAIISLDSNTPLLLLGRSGTGKTTCCLYRLWGMFLCYWEQAMKFNSPLLPRKVPDFLEQGAENSEEDKTAMGAKSDQACAESDSLFDIDQLDEEKDDDDNDILYEHLHQMFVTKNPVLCTEVEKNFLKLQHASTILHMHNTAPKKVLPNTLQEVDDIYFPLFLTSRQLLLMLDASIDGESFFPRNEDLALKVEIPGWGTQEDIFNIAPLMHDLVGSSDEDDDEDLPKKSKNPNAYGNRGQIKVNLRRECTYEVFAFEVWPRISKKVQLDCHASLVWTEIMSFIKGSYESLHTENGYLDKAQYMELGRKRAPNFSGDRSKIYDAFLLFNNYKQQHFLFDEADLVYKLYTRLRAMTYFHWTLHEIYVDETQDFTQAELALLVSLGHDPNKMFLTGDTAQSIMRGISFRFIDLKSLFYYAKESAKENEKYLANIKVPQKVHQLRYNYRSHTGILSLASSVLDILIEFFPESFDPLRKDQGMFAGPKPVVIESCSPGDLALLLTGNRRKTSHIEFGAHQAILVVNEGAKEKIPEELRTGIVLTIYESKGLEFDDILIYNFFKDSQAYKEWRVVTMFLDNLVNKVKKEDNSENLVELNTDVLDNPNRPRALTFDANQHKLLNSELKHLYTALTRARVNVWIFDEDEEKRAPMFEYFKALNLVKCMEVGDSENITEELMFADSSTPQEWKLAGDNYMKQRLYHVAAKCYSKALQPEKVKLALAHQTALEASRLKSSPKEMRALYLNAAVQFLKCNDLLKSAICFQNSKEFLLAAQAFEKNGQFEEAAAQYRKLTETRYIIDESRCLERVGQFGRAVHVLSQSKEYDRAMDCLTRYKIQIKKLKESGQHIPQVLIENKPSVTEENLCFSAANHHHGNKDSARAIAAIRRVKDVEAQIDFFRNNGYFSEAALLMMDEGRTEEAATLMLRNGQTDKALEYATDGMNKQLTAFINLVLARKYEQEKESFNLDSIKKHARKALNMYVELEDYGGQAQAKLILGKHIVDAKLLKQAYIDFDMEKPPNDMGRLESFAASMEIKLSEALTTEECRKCVNCVKQALTVIRNLNDTSKHEQQLSYLKFYGLELDVSSQKMIWYPNEFPLCQGLKLSDENEHNTEIQVKASKAEALTLIEKHVMGWIKTWSQKLKQQLALLLPKHLHCRYYLEGLTCPLKDCQYKHIPIATANEDKETLTIHFLAVILDYHLQTGLNKLPANHASREELTFLTDAVTQWDSVKKVLAYIFPDSAPASRDKADSMKSFFLNIRHCKDAVIQIERYFRYLWDNPGRVGKGKSTNVVKERCKTSDWIVQASFFSTLLKFEDLNVEKEVRDLENFLMKHFKLWARKSKKYALFQPVTDRNGQPMVETIGSRFLESLDWLKDNNPFEATFAFSKMISTLGRRNVVGLMPKPGHLIFWMEFYFTISWFFMGNCYCESKNRPYFFLSNSLLANVNLVNVSLADKDKDQSDKLQQLIIKYSSSKSKAIFTRQDHLCNFLVGQNEYSEFSLISLAEDLCSGDEPHIQLAERIVMLALCVLLNVPTNFVNHKYELAIRRELYKIQLTKSMPVHLATLIKTVNKASTYHQVGMAVIQYTQSLSGSRKLFQCQWQARESCPMKWEEVTSFPSTALTAANLEELVQITLQNIDQKQLKDDVQKDTDEDDIKKLEARRAMAEEENAKDTAIQKIVRALRLQVMRSRLRGRNFYHKFQLKEMFQRFTLTNSSCQICGVELATETAQPLEEGEPSTSQTREIHEKDESHRRSVKELKSFIQVYSTEIYYQHDEIERFLLRRKVEEKNDIYTDIQLEVSRVLTSWNNFKKVLTDTMTKLSWEDRKSVLDAFRQFVDQFKENKAKIDALYNKARDMAGEAVSSERTEVSRDYPSHAEEEPIDVGEASSAAEEARDDYHREHRGQGRDQDEWRYGRGYRRKQTYRNRQQNRGYQDGYSRGNNYGGRNIGQKYRYNKENNDGGYVDYGGDRRQYYPPRGYNHRGGDYVEERNINYPRPKRNYNNGMRDQSRNREEFMRNVPPRFQKQFYNQRNEDKF